MTQINTWASQPALSWIEKILLERYGHTFALQTTSRHTIKLTHESSSNFVELTADGATFIRKDSDLACEQWDAEIEGWVFALNNKLPAPGAKDLPSPLIEKQEYGYRIHYDILGLTYWMLSRQEEIERTDLDEHARFPATSSHAFKHQYLERPIVDEWLYILSQVIQKVWPGLTLKKHLFSTKVSHDVDAPSRYAFRSMGGMIRAIAGDLIKRHDFLSVLRAPWIRLRSKNALHLADPANTFDWIMDVSERHGLKSAFYFICGRTDASKDADYEPEHPAIRHLMRRIHARGHEIGLHPSYGSYQKSELIVAEAKRLRRVAAEEGITQPKWGGRMHYLRWEQPMTLRAWADAGMSYDSTLSYADLPGFRCGTCFEYPAFDPVHGASLDLRIRPLIAMECTVIATCYMGLGVGSAAYAKFLQLKNACRAVDGCFTLLWHNSHFETQAERELYEAVLQ